MNQEVQKRGLTSLTNTSNNELTYNDTKKGMSIRNHIKNGNAADLMKILSDVLMKMVKLYGWNISQDWTPLMCEVILDTYPGRSLEQIVWILTQGTRGKYGKITYQFNPSILHEWVQIFDKNTDWDDEINN